MSKRFHILIITGALYPNMTVTSEISYRIAHALKCNYNCEITIMGYRNNDNSYGVSNPYHFNTVNVSSIDYKIRVTEEYKNYILDNGLKPDDIIKMRLIFFDRKYRKLFIKYKKSCSRNNEKEYYKYLKKMRLEGVFDCIIVFFHPIDPINAVMRLEPKTPTIFYKLDPWSTASYNKNNKMEKKKEERADSFSNAIVTTQAIANEYRNGLLSLPNNTYIYALNFPNIVQYKKNVGKLQEVLNIKTINCVFTGSFYADIRSPGYILDLFSLLGDDKNIVFHIFGNFEFFFRFNKLPNNILYHGKVSSEDSIGIMQEADILVNVGNTTINQFPSKILTYISLGKPILNIIKRPDCPTLPYMEKYPLALNILETPEPTEEDVTRVRNFIMENKGKRIPFETIKELYYDCTPEYVGGKVYEIICKVVEEAKEKNK